MSDTRQHLSELLDRLPPAQLAAIEQLLAAMLEADWDDDDEITEEEAQAIARSTEWFKHNPGIPFEEVVADLGFTMEEVRNYRDPACKLIDRLSETRRVALLALLETIVDPVTTALHNASIDDEPQSEEERRAVAEARRSLEKERWQGCSARRSNAPPGSGVKQVAPTSPIKE
jgi:hypothetical protein